MKIWTKVISGKCNFVFLNGYTTVYAFFFNCAVCIQKYSYAALLRSPKVLSRILKIYIPKNTCLTNCSLLTTLT